MLSVYPTDVLTKLNACRVRQAGNVSALPAEAERARHIDPDNSVRQIRRVPDSFYSQFFGRDLLWRLAPEVGWPKQRCAEGTHDTAADQVGIPQSKGLRFPVVDNRVRCVRTVGRSGGAQQVSRINGIRRVDDVGELVAGKQRVVLASLVVDFSDGYIFVGAGLDSELNLAAWIGRYRQMFQRAQRHRRIGLGINPVVDERCSQRDLPAAIASR